jgi:N-carbamoyl-L-amino-acid hydrolase
VSEVVGRHVTVDAARFATLLREVGEVGWRPGRGVDRLALGPNDIEARRRIIAAARARHFEVATDRVGNLRIVRPGTDPTAPVVACGSHIDAQPGGGRFDGALGVIAGLEALLALDDRSIATRHPVALFVWVNEEGARFAPTTMGSAVFAGSLLADDALATADAGGVTLGAAVAAMHRTLGLHPVELAAPAAYVELHIEQGPVLERQGGGVGVVEGIQGIAWLRAAFDGDARHAGTTPHSARRDAGLAAARAVAAVEDWRAAAGDQQLRLTAGRVELWPNTPNTVPGRAEVTFDIRHPDGGTLDRAVAAATRRCRDAAGGLGCATELLQHEPPTVFDATVVDAVERAARRAHATSIRMVSGATHDALHLARCCAAGMIFVRCRDGVSHHHTEHAEIDDMVLGADILVSTLLELAR